MGQYNLDRIFKPSSIAVIGASEKQGSIGRALIKNLIDGGTSATLVPINPNTDEVFGLKSYPTLKASKEKVDLAVIATPITTVPEIVRECVASEVGGAIVISAGGKEIGEKGHQIEQEIRKTAYEGGLRIIGPNCLGIICPGKKINASFASDMPNTGNLAFISQSGAICTSILDWAFQERIGFSHFVSIGSMLDVDFGDMIDYLGNDSSSSSILLYIENLTNFRKFMSSARAVSRIKPIIVLKAGKSEAGAKAAASHTGAMTGEDAVYDAAFKRTGIVRVDTIQELFDCAELMAKQPRPRGPKLGIITNGGGPGVMAADMLAKFDQEPAPLPDSLVTKLNELLPPFWSRNNPIDILGDASPERFESVIETCLNEKCFDAMLIILAPQALTKPEAVAARLTEITKKTRFPIYTAWMGGRDMEKAVELLNSAGVPTYGTPEPAVRAFLYMYQYHRNLKLLQEIPPKLYHNITFDQQAAASRIRQEISENPRFLSEVQSKEILSDYGISVNPTQIAVSKDQAVTIGESLGFPLAMKILSPDITHKTDANGVQLHLRGAKDIETAWDKIIEGAKAYNPEAEILGVSVQPFISRPDFEILLGAKKDPNFGPVILFGMGGIFTEILKDRSLGLPPMNRLIVRYLMEETKLFTLLKGYRNHPGADMVKLEEFVIRLSQLVVDFPEIKELDMNPVIVKNGIPLAIDARILLEKSTVLSPMHLVISPYPAHMECRTTAKNGINVLIRPIKPEDAPVFLELFNTLSAASRYYRFFSPLKELSRDMLARFTQIDYDREIAMVAIKEEDGDKEVMLGVARIITDPDGKIGEFSVLVGDPWQGMGIGAKLLIYCLEIAKNRGVNTVYGLVLRENVNMLGLGKRLGFKIRWEGSECELTIDLRTAILDNYNET